MGSIRQRFGLRAKNARAENPRVNNGFRMRQIAETAYILGRVLKTQRFDNAFGLPKVQEGSSSSGTRFRAIWLN